MTLLQKAAFLLGAIIGALGVSCHAHYEDMHDPHLWGDPPVLNGDSTKSPKGTSGTFLAFSFADFMILRVRRTV
jgi:hypothetical protein